MNAEELSEQLRNNPDSIIKVMINLGFVEENIRYNSSSNCITCTRPFPDADNMSGFMIYTNSLWWQYNTRSGKGNIYTLVMDLKKVNFPQSLRLIAGWIGYKFKNDGIKIIPPFGGVFKKIAVNSNILDTELDVYESDKLPPPACNKRFYDDGISYSTQQYFDLRFDCEDNAIVIPIYNMHFELVGSKARKNEDVVVGSKYWTPLSFSKTSVVYGVAQNYKSIVKKQKVVIFEAEKSVMQCFDFKLDVAVAVMGHDISMAQARIIKSLMCLEIIIAFDEGVSEDEIKKAAAMVYSDTPMYHNKVSYLLGGLPKNSKMSPSDLGREKFRELFEQKKTFEPE